MVGIKPFEVDTETLNEENYKTMSIVHQLKVY